MPLLHRLLFTVALIAGMIFAVNFFISIGNQ